MAKGRPSKEVEFLRTLRWLRGLNQTKFAKACGKKPSNMSKYLAGQLQPSKKVLTSCVRNVFEWAVEPLKEIQPVPKNLNDLPKKSGMYILYDSAGGILYIGKATNFRAEIKQTLARRLPEPLRFGPKLTKRRPYLREVASRLSLYEILSARLRHNVEAMFLRAVANQTHNSNIGKAK
jgi:transcriptional regulator with XRE-family HTH domain